MRLHDRRNDGQPEPRSSASAASAGVGPVERLERVHALLLRESGSVVGDLEDRGSVGLAEGHVDVRAQPGDAVGNYGLSSK